MAYVQFPKSVPFAIFIVMLGILEGCNDEKPIKAKTQEVVASQPTPSTHDLPITGKKVLLVHSYHAGYPWVVSITQGVKDALKGTGVGLEVYYMDTKRHPQVSFMIRAGELARAKVAQYKPDVVISADDAAQEYFTQKYHGASLPFVFCGVNADPSKYNYPAPNITGIIERCPFGATLKYARKCLPIRRIAVLSCDDYTSQATFSYIKQQKVDVDVLEYKLTNDFEEWKELVKRYSKTVDAVFVYTYHTLKEHRGDTLVMEPNRVMAWTIENATVPIIGSVPDIVEGGALCAVPDWPHEHGELAARYALDILRGTSPSALPIIPAKIGQRLINRRTAAKFGIKLTSELTKDAIIISKE